jgi:hypothetical protein
MNTSVEEIKLLDSARLLIRRRKRLKGGKDFQLADDQKILETFGEKCNATNRINNRLIFRGL